MNSADIPLNQSIGLDILRLKKNKLVLLMIIVILLNCNMFRNEAKQNFEYCFMNYI